MHLIEHIESLFMQRGQTAYYGSQVSALQHALQCAQLAEWAYADDALVAAALLHDLGDLVDGPEEHELRALPLLEAGFGPEVTQPIALHVQAKRYLVATDAPYAQQLMPIAVQGLARRGGAMTPDEVRIFEETAYAADAVALRRWDDLSRSAGKRTPPLEYYLTLLEQVLQRPFVDSKIGIGSLSVA